MNFEDKIINQIIGLLAPLKTNYQIEIDEIIIDLLNHKTTSLKNFVNKHYHDLDINPEIKNLITNLVNDNLLSKDFLNQITDNSYQIIDASNYVITYFKSRPLNVKENILQNIKDTLKKKNTSINTSSLENTHDLRKKILEAQINYINNAASFIQDLEQKDASLIYNDLIELNDIRFIQHSISKLSQDTLKRFLNFIESKNDNHSSIDLFINEAIKKNLHKK